MEATLIGENGAIVLSRVVEAPVQEADHAPIPLRSTVEKTACPWDQVRKLSLAMEVLVQVNFCGNFSFSGELVVLDRTLQRSLIEAYKYRNYHIKSFYFLSCIHKRDIRPLLL